MSQLDSKNQDNTSELPSSTEIKQKDQNDSLLVPGEDSSLLTLSLDQKRVSEAPLTHLYLDPKQLTDEREFLSAALPPLVITFFMVLFAWIAHDPQESHLTMVWNPQHWARALLGDIAIAGAILIVVMAVLYFYHQYQNTKAFVNFLKQEDGANYLGDYLEDHHRSRGTQKYAHLSDSVETNGFAKFLYHLARQEISPQNDVPDGKAEGAPMEAAAVKFVRSFLQNIDPTLQPSSHLNGNADLFSRWSTKLTRMQHLWEAGKEQLPKAQVQQGDLLLGTQEKRRQSYLQHLKSEQQAVKIQQMRENNQRFTVFKAPPAQVSALDSSDNLNNSSNSSTISSQTNS